MLNRKLIVDTHYLIWDMMGSERFTPKAEKLISNNQGNCYYSSISHWEVGMLVGKGRLVLPVSVSQFFYDLQRKRGYTPLYQTPEIGDLTHQFANLLHGDPADRVIAATTIHHRATLLTADTKLLTATFIETV